MLLHGRATTAMWGWSSASVRVMQATRFTAIDHRVPSFEQTTHTNTQTSLHYTQQTWMRSRPSTTSWFWGLVGFLLPLQPRCRELTLDRSHRMRPFWVNTGAGVGNAATNRFTVFSVSKARRSSTLTATTTMEGTHHR